MIPVSPESNINISFSERPTQIEKAATSYGQASESSVSSSAASTKRCLSSLWDNFVSLLISFWERLKRLCGYGTTPATPGQDPSATPTQAQQPASSSSASSQTEQPNPIPTGLPQTNEEWRAQLDALAVEREKRTIVDRLNVEESSLQAAAAEFREAMNGIDPSVWKGKTTPSSVPVDSFFKVKEEISDQIRELLRSFDPTKISRLKELTSRLEQVHSDLKAAWKKIPQEVRAGAFLSSHRPN